MVLLHDPIEQVIKAAVAGQAGVGLLPGAGVAPVLDVQPAGLDVPEVRGDDEFALFVLPADRKVDSGAIRRELQFRRLRFATREELATLTGLVPGSVPPFGRPILPLTLYVDAAVCDNDRIAFNAGSLTDSIILSRDDYLRLASPERIFAFSTAL